MKFNLHNKGDKVNWHNGKLVPVTILKKIWYDEGLEYKVMLPGGKTRVVPESQLPSMNKETRSRVMITVFGRRYACAVHVVNFDIATDRYYSNSILGCIRECPAKNLDAKAIGKKFEYSIKSELAETKKRMRSIERKIKKFEDLIYGYHLV